MRPALRIILIGAAGACLALGTALGGDGGAPAPRQGPPRQVAQACRTLCVEELNACMRSCEGEAIRISCQSQCQTRFDLCTWNCR